jgi:viroplasmin and RNaseH domain-containing protein
VKYEVKIIIDGTRIVGTTESSIKAVVALMQVNYSEAALMILEGLPYSPDSNIIKMIQKYVTKENDIIIINKLVKGLSQKQFSINRTKTTPIIRPIIKNKIKVINEEINKELTKPNESERNRRKPSKRGEHVINNNVLKVTFIFFN